MVAGAIKTIEEVKKMARHASPSHEHEAIPHHHASFFRSRFHGWGDERKLEEGWKLTHGQASVHESAAVRAAEAASRRAARGDADSGDGFFDSWGKVTPKSHIGGKITTSTPIMKGPTSAPATAAPSPSGPASSSAPSTQARGAEGGASDSSLEPPPLPSFLKEGADPLSEASAVSHTHSKHASSSTKAHDASGGGGGGGGGGGEGSSRGHAHGEGEARAGKAGGEKKEGGGGKAADPIDKLIALQRLKRRQKEKALVRWEAHERASGLGLRSRV